MASNIGEEIMSGQRILIGVLGFFALLALASLLNLNIPGPQPWLEPWTKWIAAVVGIVVSARVLWAGAAALQRFADRP